MNRVVKIVCGISFCLREKVATGKTSTKKQLSQFPLRICGLRNPTALGHGCSRFVHLR